MEKIEVTCAACGAEFALRESYAGKLVKCSHCSAPLQVPLRAPEPGLDTRAEAEAARRRASAARGPAEEPEAREEPDRLAPLSILVGLGAAVAGAFAWGLVMQHMDREIGYLAWGIGALVGIGMKATGSRGTAAGAMAAVLALASIFGGKVHGLHGLLAEYDRYGEFALDALALAELGPAPTEQELRGFMVRRDYTDAASAADISPQAVDEFVQFRLPMLEAIQSGELSRELWNETEGTSDWSVTDSVRAAGNTFSALDFVFAGLGIATAFRLLTAGRAAPE